MHGQCVGTMFSKCEFLNLSCQPFVRNLSVFLYIRGAHNVAENFWSDATSNIHKTVIEANLENAFHIKFKQASLEPIGLM